MTEATADVLQLDEQSDTVVSLVPDEIAALTELKFSVVPQAKDETETRRYTVNPGALVGHFRLPSGRLVTIKPKYPAAVLRMLAYVYRDYGRDVLRKELVNYAPDKLLFEPLVEWFNDELEQRVRRGLVQNYVEHAENLAVLRGRIDFPRHVQLHQDRPERLACRYFERTSNTPGNQAIKWTLDRLRRQGGWKPATEELLRKNALAFQDVRLADPGQFLRSRRNYDRLNADYELLHELCGMFLEGTAFTERLGEVSFRGFLLNMNDLFEQFVTRGFERAANSVGLRAEAQHSSLLSRPPFHTIEIRPDIIVRRRTGIVTIADAKYTREQVANHHVYQVLAYGISHECTQLYLVYPVGVEEFTSPVHIAAVGTTINIHQVELSGDCVEQLEAGATKIIQRLRLTILPSASSTGS